MSGGVRALIVDVRSQAVNVNLFYERHRLGSRHQVLAAEEMSSHRSR